MKFTKEIKIEIEITEELIQHLNEQFINEEEDDFNDPEQLKALFDELICMSPYGVLDEIWWDGVRKLTNIKETTKLEK